MNISVIFPNFRILPKFQFEYNCYLGQLLCPNKTLSILIKATFSWHSLPRYLSDYLFTTNRVVDQCQTEEDMYRQLNNMYLKRAQKLKTWPHFLKSRANSKYIHHPYLSVVSFYIMNLLICTTLRVNHHKINIPNLWIIFEASILRGGKILGMKQIIILISFTF